MSVEKLPGGTGYKVRWRDSAGKSRRKTVRLWRDAVTLDGEMKRKKAMGELIAHEKGRITLNDFWEVWWTQYALMNLTPRTRETYSNLWRVHLKPQVGQTQARQLTTNDVSKLLSLLGTTHSSSTVRQIAAILQGVLERAVEWGYIPTNPAKGIRKPKLVSRRGRALRDDEVAALLIELPGLRDQVIVRVLAGTGMRPGELRALLWSELDEPFVYVLAAVSSNQRGPTKTNSERSVEAEPYVWNSLRQWQLACGRPSKIEPVFPGANGKLWTDQGWKMWQRQVFRPAAQRAGLGDLRPYDLRHTYASQRIAAGDDILTLASQLGHSPTMTLTVYGHLLRGGRRDQSADVVRLSAQP